MKETSQKYPAQSEGKWLLSDCIKANLAAEKIIMYQQPSTSSSLIGLKAMEALDLGILL